MRVVRLGSNGGHRRLDRTFRSAQSSDAAPTRMRSTFRRVAKGRPFVKSSQTDDASLRLTQDKELSVLSYNLLAPLYVRPIDRRTGTVQDFAAFAWCGPTSVSPEKCPRLRWETRRQKIRRELVNARVDLILLQEVQFERDEDGESRRWALPEWLRLQGYSFAIPSQGSLTQIAERNLRVLGTLAPIGNAIMWRNERIARVSGDEADLEKRKIKSGTTRVVVRVRGRTDGALRDLPETLVASVHLDATSESKRVKMLIKTMKECARLACAGGMIVGGDMNAELTLGCAVGAVVRDAPRPSRAQFERECAVGLRLAPSTTTTNGTAHADDGGGDDDDARKADDVEATVTPSTTQVDEWISMWENARRDARLSGTELLRVPTGPTRAGYDHGKSVGPCVSWKLDHIFFSASSLELRSMWNTLEADHASLASGLPNETCPSDHYPIAASFRPVRCATNDDDAFSRSIVSRVASMERVHREETSVLERAIRDDAPAVVVDFESSQGGDDETKDDETVATRKRRKKKSKKKKGRPPAEVLAYYRERRERMSTLETSQRVQRTKLVNALTDHEYRVLERILAKGESATTSAPLERWVQCGRRGSSS